MTTIIQSLLTLIGITQAPATISELIWDIVLIIVSMILIKWICAALFSVMRWVTRM